MSLRIIPVIDLMNGLAVRGVAGRRDQYRPIISQLTPSAKLLDVAAALVERFHPQEIYLADLDAIEGKDHASTVLSELGSLSKSVWIDAGIRSVDQALELAEAGFKSIVVGLETVPNPQVLEAIVHRIGPERVIFSMDFKASQLLGNALAWQLESVTAPLSIAERIHSLGIRQLIVLDLAQVGMNAGTGTEELCRSLASTYPDLEVITGGGIRDVEDLRRLEGHGVRGALVASALHDGRIQPSDWPK